MTEPCRMERETDCEYSLGTDAGLRIHYGRAHLSGYLEEVDGNSAVVGEFVVTITDELGLTYSCRYSVVGAQRQ